MSWFKKTARNWGQIPFSLDDALEDENEPYERKNKANPRLPKKKDLFQSSLGFGTEGHNADEETASGPNLGQIDSLTSGYQKDHQVYNSLGDGGSIKEETPDGRTVDRTDFKGTKTESPAMSGGIVDDALGNYVLNYTPDDYTPQERIMKNLSDFRNKPSKKVKINNNIVNVLD